MRPWFGAKLSPPRVFLSQFAARHRHGSPSELYRRRVTEHGHRQERGLALAPAQVPAGSVGLGDKVRPAVAGVGATALTSGSPGRPQVPCRGPQDDPGR